MPQYKVLIFDDSEEDRNVWRAKFGRSEVASFVVHTAENTGEALRLVSEESYDLLLIDYRLGSDLTGIDFSRTLSEQGHLEPILLITGLVTPELRSEALEAGIYQVLSKGETSDEALGIIASQVVDSANADSGSSQVRHLLRSSVRRQDLLATVGQQAKVQAMSRKVLEKTEEMHGLIAEVYQGKRREPPKKGDPLWEKVVYRVENNPLLWTCFFLIALLTLGIIVLSTLLHPELVNLLDLKPPTSP